MSERVVGEIFDLYDKYGGRDYLCEDVTQQEHMIQCAMNAEKDGQPLSVILGAFLHDIGHLLALAEGLDRMTDNDGKLNLGGKNHEGVGADWLDERGFGSDVTDLVRHHVNAKRYLVYKDDAYRDSDMMGGYA